MGLNPSSASHLPVALSSHFTFLRLPSPVSKLGIRVGPTSEDGPTELESISLKCSATSLAGNKSYIEMLLG